MKSPIVLLLATLLGDSPAQHEPVRVSAEIGTDRAVVEIRDLAPEAAAQAAREALEIISAVERELSTSNPSGMVGRLNAAAGTGPREVHGDFGRLLQTAQGFCLWSRGAWGPLGGILYQTWETAVQPPPGNTLERGVRTATCENLTLQPESLSVSLAAGSQLDLRHLVSGYAVDRAVHHLSAAGASNVWVEYRSVIRASGAGPAGAGWEVSLPLMPGMTEALAPIRLRDQALAIVSTHRNRFRFGEISFAPFIDQRSGAPATGTMGVLVATHLAVDAQAIGSALVIVGSREGQLRLGGVVPSPSVLWMLGDGSGAPLLATYRWSELRVR